MLEARVSTDKEVCHATSKDYKYMYFYNLCYNQECRLTGLQCYKQERRLTETSAMLQARVSTDRGLPCYKQEHHHRP